MGPNGLLIKATSEDTGGRFFLSETTVAPGFPGPPPHVHDDLVGMFYVLEGTLTLRLGDEELEAGPGTFACAPPGTVHTFSNRSDAPVRFLNFNTPGGWEQVHARSGRSVRRRRAAHAGGDRTDRLPV